MEDLTQLLPKAVGSAAEQAPILGLIWYMLKDVRTRLERFEAGLAELNLRVVAQDFSAQINHIKERLVELRADKKSDHEEIHAKITAIESEIKALWKRLGNRPLDLPA